VGVDLTLLEECKMNGICSVGFMSVLVLVDLSLYSVMPFPLQTEYLVISDERLLPPGFFSSVAQTLQLL